MAEITILLGGFPGRSERGYLGWSGCYLVTTTKGERILFDTAGYNERAVVVAKLAERGISPESLDLVILSHLHFDHAANWDVFPKAEIVVHERELAYAASPEADGAILRFHSQALRAERRVRVVSGDEIALAPELTLLHVPGHTPGAIALAAEGCDPVRRRAQEPLGSARQAFPALVERGRSGAVNRATENIRRGALSRTRRAARPRRRRDQAARHAHRPHLLS